ncbi:MAG: hypothetical protein U0231_15105 [Nitrospiraceae bacterium]
MSSAPKSFSSQATSEGSNWLYDVKAVAGSLSQHLAALHFTAHQLEDPRFSSGVRR